MKIGKIKGELTIDLEPLVRQEPFGIMTEGGVVKTEGNLPMMVQVSSNRNSASNFFNNLERLYKILKQALDEYFGHRKQELYEEIVRNLEEISIVLVQKDSVNFKVEELIQSQHLFIKIAKFLLSYTPEMEDDLRKGGYSCLKKVMARTELSLEYLGFEEKDPYASQKKEVGISYIGFMNQCLRLALTGIRQKGLEDNEKGFIEFCLSYCYFRHTKFKIIIEDLLRCSMRMEQATFEWRKYYGGVHQYFNVQQRRKSSEVIETQTTLPPEVSPLLDWHTFFYKHFYEMPEAMEEENIFMELVKEEDWRIKINKKGVGFFYFVAESCMYLVTYIDKKVLLQIDNLEIPGYECLISAFMHELKKADYSDAVVYALLCAIESNPKLINAIFPIICLKTK